MPKSKEYLSSTDSSSDDNSSSDEKPKQKKMKKEEKKQEAKKPAPSKKKSSSSSASSVDDNEQKGTVWELGNLKQVSIDGFKGKTYVNIRTMYMDKNSELKPTKKGIALNLEQWRKLVDSMEEVDKELSAKC